MFHGTLLPSPSPPSGLGLCPSSADWLTAIVQEAQHAAGEEVKIPDSGRVALHNFKFRPPWLTKLHSPIHDDAALISAASSKLPIGWRWPGHLHRSTWPNDIRPKDALLRLGRPLGSRCTHPDDVYESPRHIHGRIADARTPVPVTTETNTDSLPDTGSWSIRASRSGVIQALGVAEQDKTVSCNRARQPPALPCCRKCYPFFARCCISQTNQK